MKIAIIGKGNVGKALASGLEPAGHEIRFGDKNPQESVEDASTWGEILILAVPYTQLRDVVEHVGERADGKAVIDVTNVLDANRNMAIGFTTSGAEELQKMLPRAKIIKAFNTVFAEQQGKGKLGEERLTAFVAGDDKEAKETVMNLTKDIGFEPIDCGPLSAARYLEPMGMQLISLGYELGLGSKIGYRLIRD
ncbi:MAG: NADPH-dependent F420 reductase [Euryarchaeota archaeon]|nr:NADPH-dependent F420 reductase [Euryarchaeota archaeon]